MGTAFEDERDAISEHHLPRPRPMGAPGARLARATDTPTLLETLVNAFLDDPVTEWACRPERLRPTVLKRFYAGLLPGVIANGEIWTAGEGASAALWRAPGCWRTSTREDIALARALLHPRLLPRLPLVAGGLLGIERRHPDQRPHWYLATLGTDPVAQGRGLASAALRPILDQCDVDGIGAYLESSKERNIAFYARHGFAVSEELCLPRGPRLWAMWREPRR